MPFIMQHVHYYLILKILDAYQKLDIVEATNDEILGKVAGY